SNMARTIANQLIESGKVNRGYLGVMLSEMDLDLAKELGVPGEYKGALVRSVEPGKPADKAGVEAGDVVVAVGDTKVENVQHLRNLIGLRKPGETVKLKLIRNEKTKTISVKLGNFEDSTYAAE